MKRTILYIGDRPPGHNRDIHIDFIESLHRNGIFNIIGYGNFFKKNSFKSFPADRKKAGSQIEEILRRHRPCAILTYNRNGSSYDAGLDNPSLYGWLLDSFSRLDIPKFHVTTDYCRSGFREEQSKWFVEAGYTAAFFRHRESMKYPLDIDSHWLPFSIDKGLYHRGLVHAKNGKVGFIGAAHETSVELYANRVSAIDFLLKKNMLNITRIIKKPFKRAMLSGKEYVSFLSKNSFNLTCGGSCNYFTAKYFQIPASKSMLICSNTNGLDIFPKDTYISYSPTSLDQMLDKINYFNKNKKEYAYRVNKLSNFVLDNHNHSKRGLELSAIIGGYLK